MAGRESISEESVTAEVSPEALDPLVGVTLDGRFRIVERIGNGAMGKVYRAVQVPLNRAVAIKVLDSRYGAGRDESFRQRFLVEAALTAKLSHPNTVRVLDYGSTNGLFYLAMEYLDGESLEGVLKKGAQPWRRVLAMGQQMARALKEAHSLGVVHRDLKPANVVLLNTDDDADHVKVLDFGLVKSFVDGQELEGRAITQQGMLMGSPPYMAPEQGERNRADPRSDIYSLGVVLFEALVGRVPFGGNSPIEIILKHVHEPVPPIVTPPNLEPIPDLMIGVVNKCLAKSPMDRFQSMDEVLMALQEISAPIHTPAVETPVSDASIPIATVETTKPGRHPAVLMLGFLFAMAAGIGGTALLMRSSATDPKLPAPVVPAVEPAAVPKTAEAQVAPPPPVPPAPAFTTVTVHVESEPAGAQVTLAGKVLGVTPLDFERPAGPAGNTPIEFTLSKTAFGAKVVALTAQRARVEVKETLVPMPPKVEPVPVVEQKDKPASAESKEPKVVEKAPRGMSDNKTKKSPPPVVASEPVPMPNLVPLPAPVAAPLVRTRADKRAAAAALAAQKADQAFEKSDEADKAKAAPPEPVVNDPGDKPRRRVITGDPKKATVTLPAERPASKLEDDDEPAPVNELKRPSNLHPGK